MNTDAKRFFQIDMQSLRFINLLWIFCFLSLVSCAKQSANDPIDYLLPAGWEVFEEVKINEQHRKINIVTQIGSILTIEILSGPVMNSIDSNEYLKKYIASALPTEEIRSNAVIDFGEVKRSDKSGYFAKVTVPSPNQASFTLELYQYQSEKINVFLMFNTPTEQQLQLQPDIDNFIKSIKI
jgi:hypothetical protein